MAVGGGLGRMGEGIGLRSEDRLSIQNAERRGILVVIITAVIFSIVGRCLFGR